MTDKTPFLEIKGLTVRYLEDEALPLPVLKNISFSVNEGEYVAILGHNGSGKSTLAKMINLVDDNVSAEGSIIVDGVDVLSPDLTDEQLLDLRRSVGMVFQNPDNQLVATVVEEDVAFGPENLGIPNPELMERVDRALATVGMTEYAHHEPHRLSGGQKQRVAIAGIIAMMPRCMIFDEATAMLDPVGRREVVDTIEMLNREKGITVLTITHYMDEAARADRVIVLDDGQIILDGKPEEVFAHERELRMAGLELPQCTDLCRRLSKRLKEQKGIELSGKFNNIDQCVEAIVELARNVELDDDKRADTDAPVGKGYEASDDEILRLENVSYTYSKGTPYEIRALDDVSIGIKRGGVTGIIGHTGSGKSTFVQLLNGLNRPEDGKVLLSGKDIWQNPKEIGKVRFAVGLVMQYPEYQLFEETVAADIAFGPKNMKLDENEISLRVAEAVEFVGLDRELLGKSPFDLSGGQKRRVAIAGIMAMRPDVLVLDEPAAGLDPRGRHEIFNGIREYNRKTGCSVIIVSHSMEDMAEYCDDVIVMAHSKVLMAGDRDHIFSRAAELESVGLDIPRITKLMGRLCDGGLPVDRGLYTVDSAEEELSRLFKLNCDRS
ncbi:MAG: energy-coupling factor transporter ATPase [Clostridia bacterium]|nr:energy-coupling factor transporter ATPase [Clostridia bacterium]